MLLCLVIFNKRKNLKVLAICLLIVFETNLQFTDTRYVDHHVQNTRERVCEIPLCLSENLRQSSVSPDFFSNKGYIYPYL